MSTFLVLTNGPASRRPLSFTVKVFFACAAAAFCLAAALPTNSVPVLSAAAPPAAQASVFSDYVTCVTGVGVPAGVGVLLWPVRAAIAAGARRAPSGNPAVGYWFNRYARHIRGACWRFTRS